jgi:hypothetical protein
VASRAISFNLKARAGVRQTDGISILAASTNAEMDDDNDDTKKSSNAQASTPKAAISRMASAMLKI